MATHPIAPRVPELAILNARVWTGDARRPWADAVLVRDSIVEAIGSSAEIKKRCKEETVIVDAKKMLLTRSAADWASDATLARGVPANLVVVRGDAFRVTADFVRDAEVVLEIVDGRIVHDPDGLAR